MRQAMGLVRDEGENLPARRHSLGNGGRLEGTGKKQLSLFLYKRGSVIWNCFSTSENSSKALCDFDPQPERLAQLHEVEPMFFRNFAQSFDFEFLILMNQNIPKPAHADHPIRQTVV